ncbi:MAG: uroporphyrinogen decarboxylase [Planctomycetota bacterium]
MESRRAEEFATLIRKSGGVPHVSPSMRETPLEDNRAAVEFAHRLIGGEIDAMILLTGVGTEQFVSQVERHVGRERLLNAISDVPTLARGPKPVAALSRLGLRPTMRAPEPNTWREVLETLDREMPVANMRLGLQEYGVTNPSLVAGLEARGAQVDRLRVYQWDLPEDTAPLEANIHRLIDESIDVLMFTSAQQIDHLLAVAGKMELAGALRSVLERVVVASIGPTTSERLRASDLPVDLEASPPKMGQFVRQTAEQAMGLLRRKRTLSQSAMARQRVDVRTGGEDTADANDPLRDAPFLRACRGEPTDFTPVWLMRQAGRYMPEYREVRAKTSFLELCKNPALCSEVMCTAVDFLGVDAAIIFSDLLPILEPMGMELEFAPGDGPVIHNPVRESTDVDRLLDLDSVDSLHFVVETVRQTRADLPSHLPLIGFAGAPFTLASYAIEGGSSRNYLHTKTLMYRDEGAWRTLMQRFARAVTLYLNAQIAAGAQAVQLFDSWVGCLGPEDYKRFVLPYVRELIDGLTPGAPVIHFGAGNPKLLPLIAEAGGDVIGIDWRVSLADAWQNVGHDRSVQGNLDPISLLAPVEEIRQRTASVLDQAEGRPGHIFNLGHGIVPQTPPDHAKALVDMVHELSTR